MGFKIASSGDFQNSQLWCTSNFGTRLGGFLGTQKGIKTDGFQSSKFSGDFQNSQFWCTSNFGTRLGVSDKKR